MDVDVVVMGAGAVGLAIAAEFARSGHDVLVLEAADGIGTGTSSRNSEVIHAGMYYPTGSLRHRMCVEGRRKLYAYLEQRGVPHLKRGKLIVATIATMKRPRSKASMRPVSRMASRASRLISGANAMAWEPNLACTAALWSPETGIVDSHGYMLALQGEIEDHGGMIAFANAGRRASSRLATGGFRVTHRRREPSAISCAGVSSTAPASTPSAWRAAIEGYRADLIPKLVLAKGNYFGCSGRPAFSRLIYPAPVEGGLGVHVTLDLAGRMRFGPDVEWLSTTDPGSDRLHRRPEALSIVLRCDPPLLAGLAGWRDHAGLFRLPSQAVRPWRAGGRLPHRRAGAARHRRAGEPVRDRIARPHQLAGDR